MNAGPSQRNPPPIASVRRAVRDVRAATALAPVRPAWSAGLRAAVATVVPLLVDLVLHTGGGTWMSLAGFSGSLADKGGAYRTRAATIAALTLGGAITAALGALLSRHPIAAVPLTLLVATACTLGRAYANAGVGVAVSTLNIYVISLAYPPSGAGEWLSRAAFVVAGGLWAMLVSLVLWPIRPYRPVRLAVGDAWRAVAEYAEQLADGLRTGRMPGPSRVRPALESAAAALAAVRRGRPGESGRGERLLVLNEAADRLFGQAFALTDVLDALSADGARPEVLTGLADTVAQVAGTAAAIAIAVEQEGGHPSIAVPWSGAALREAGAAAALEGEAAAHLEQAAVLLDRMAQYAGVASATVGGLNDGTRLPLPERPREVEDIEPPLAWLAPIRTALAPGSLVFRAALRVGIVTAVAVGLAAALELKRGYWVTITAVIILQPYVGATSRRALERVLGTVVGGALTALLAAWFHTPLAVLGLTFVGAVLSVALLPLSYAVFSIFLTPTFVLLAEVGAGDWHLAGLRIINTLLGGGLALAGSRLLWPSPEAERLPVHLAAVISAMRAYLADTVARFDDRSEAASAALRLARRRVGLAILNADDSLQRALDEHPGEPGELAAAMTLATYARRFTASTAALALSRHEGLPPPAGTLVPWAGGVGAVLEDLAAALTEGRPPAPYTEPPELPADGVSPLLRGRARRIARQLATLHATVSRIERG